MFMNEAFEMSSGTQRSDMGLFTKFLTKKKPITAM